MLTFMHSKALRTRAWARVLRAPLGMAAVWALASPWGLAQSVVFINPGQSNEAYWVAASQAMHKAAHSLGMQLQVVYAERNHLANIAIAQQLAQQPPSQRPDYVVFANDYSVAPSVLKALQGSGIQAFMAFSGIQDALRAQVGRPRERFAFWLGSLVPNAQEAGYLTAKALIQAAAAQPALQDTRGKLQLLAIAGDRSTPSSIERNRGMRQAVQEAAGTVELQQVVFGAWRTDKAQAQAEVLFQRYPQARVVWSGSDLMAWGAMQAWQARGGTPGKDALFSGINTSQRALAQLRGGQLSALAGGHFLAGAWAMVLLFDYHQGVDFIDEGLELERPMFHLFDAQSSRQIEQIMAEPALDFRPFSKHQHPQLRRYDFNLQRLLH